MAISCASSSVYCQFQQWPRLFHYTLGFQLLRVFAMSFIKETFPNDPENTPTLISKHKVAPKKLPFRYTARIFYEFCQSTSLHGYSYLNNFSSLWLKLFWIFVILSMTGLGIAFLVSNTNQYFEARLVTNIESSSADLSVSIIISDKAWTSRSSGRQTERTTCNYLKN